MFQALSRFQTRILWIAALAIFFGSMVPSLTTLLASSSSGSWIEVCTSTGTKLVAVNADEEPADNSIHTGVHCPYCRLQQDLPAIAHAPGVLVLADGSVPGVPHPPTLTPPFAVAVWPAHHSRAPPHLS